MVSIVIRTHHTRHRRNGEKMLVILLNPDAAQKQALQTVGKSRENFNIPEKRVVRVCLYLEPEEK